MNKQIGAAKFAVLPFVALVVLSGSSSAQQPQNFDQARQAYLTAKQVEASAKE
jgi:hypothetical protein